eukprot:5534844-Amphidinium_carterae.1
MAGKKAALHRPLLSAGDMTSKGGHSVARRKRRLHPPEGQRHPGKDARLYLRHLLRQSGASTVWQAEDAKPHTKYNLQGSYQ